MSKWIEGKVAGIRFWTPELFTLLVDAPELSFVAGQFARLALPAPPGAAEEMVGRPYSFANPPGSAPYEFYVVTVPGGPLSPRLAALGAGAPIWLLRSANGFFCVDEVPAAPVLWCLATGTGLGPFMSILRTAEPWRKFARVILVHGVRYGRELAYRDELDAIRAAHPAAFDVVSLVSREASPAALAGRIPAAIDDGRLEAAAGVALTAENSQVMLCGNPAMIDDAQAVLARRGMKKHRRRAPGHLTFETYW